MTSITQVLFINSPCPFLDEDSLEPPLGILMICSVLLQNGIKVKVIDLSGLSIKESLKKLESINITPQIVGFSTYTASYHITKQLINKIKEVLPQAIMVAGGPHASAMPKLLLKHFDYVIVGEGELAFLKLVKKLLSGNMCSSIIFAEPISNLNALPFPAYELVDVQKYKRKINGNNCLSILTSRGCSHSCAFCNSRVFSRGKKNLRLRSPENIAKEISFLNNIFNINNIRFQDDMFTISIQRVKAIMQLSPTIQYSCFARADTLSKEMCNLLASTGCYQLAVGVESGASTILRAMHKDVTKNIICEGLINAYKAGLNIRIYLMVGFPGESDQTIDETKNFLRTIPFNEFVVYPAIPYPGTPLFEEKEKFDITWINNDFSKYVQVGKNRSSAFVMKTSTFGPREVFVWRKELINYLEKYGKIWYENFLTINKTNVSK